MVLVYSFGLAVALAIILVTPLVLDRYFLPVLWILVLVPLREFTSAQPRVDAVPSWRWAGVVGVMLFGLLEQHDYMAHAAARWEAAEQLAGQGVLPRYIDAGFEWQGYYLFDEAARDIRGRGDFTSVPFPPRSLLDPKFVVSDVPVDGYSEVNAVTYRSWLNGGQERQVLVFERR